MTQNGKTDHVYDYRSVATPCDMVMVCGKSLLKIDPVDVACLLANKQVGAHINKRDMTQTGKTDHAYDCRSVATPCGMVMVCGKSLNCLILLMLLDFAWSLPFPWCGVGAGTSFWVILFDIA